MLKLKCEICGVEYEKPDDFKNEHSNVFYRWSLKYCDTCRRKKELSALKEGLPIVIDALSKEK